MYSPQNCPECDGPLKEYNTQCPWCGVKVEIKRERRKQNPILRHLPALFFFAILGIVDAALITLGRPQLDYVFSRASNIEIFPDFVPTFMDLQFFVIILSVVLNLVAAYAILVFARKI